MEHMTFEQMKDLETVLDHLEYFCKEFSNLPEHKKEKFWKLIKYVLVQNIGFYRKPESTLSNFSKDPFLYTPEAYNICYRHLIDILGI